MVVQILRAVKKNKKNTTFIADLMVRNLDQIMTYLIVTIKEQPSVFNWNCMPGFVVIETNTIVYYYIRNTFKDDLQCTPAEIAWSIKRGKQKKKKPKQYKTNRATQKRGNPSLELSYLLNPPLSYTVSNRLSNCSPTIPSSLLISVYRAKESSPPCFIVGKACWSHDVNTHKYCSASAF